MATYSGIYTATQQLQSAGGPALWPGVAQPGQQLYQGGAGSTSAGSSTMYTWVCPAGIGLISVVCIGAGATGNSMVNQGSATSGGGGGLGWKNNITVIPGNSYTVAVGDSNSFGTSAGNPTANGGESYFINASTVRGGGGGGAPSGTGGTYTGDGGGNGGNGGTGLNGYPSGPYSVAGGAGGAGGYTNNGGNGGINGAAGSAGSGGGGGGGGSGPYEYNSPYYPWGGGGGGGVGVLGTGSNGAGGAAGVISPPFSSTSGGGGGGGSGGSNGGAAPPYSTGGGGTGGRYGGGGGAGLYAAIGDIGAVRIIWAGGSGAPRSYPSNASNVAT